MLRWPMASSESVVGSKEKAKMDIYLTLPPEGGRIRLRNDRVYPTLLIECDNGTASWAISLSGDRANLRQVAETILEGLTVEAVAS